MVPGPGLDASLDELRATYAALPGLLEQVIHHATSCFNQLTI